MFGIFKRKPKTAEPAPPDPYRSVNPHLPPGYASRLHTMALSGYCSFCETNTLHENFRYTDMAGGVIKCTTCGGTVGGWAEIDRK